MNEPKKSALWNALLTVMGVALTAWMGWISLQIIDMQTNTQNRFTNLDGERLRQDITDITTDIDKRLSLSENDTRWVKSIMMASGDVDHHTFDNVGNSITPPVPVPFPGMPNNIMPMPSPTFPHLPAPTPPPPTAEPAPSPEPEQMRKYDIRSRSKK